MSKVKQKDSCIVIHAVECQPKLLAFTQFIGSSLGWKDPRKKLLSFLPQFRASWFFIFLVACFCQPIIVSRNKFLLNDAPTNVEVKVTFAENHIKLLLMSWQVIWRKFSFLNQETSFNFFQQPNPLISLVREATSNRPRAHSLKGRSVPFYGGNIFSVLLAQSKCHGDAAQWLSCLTPT